MFTRQIFKAARPFQGQIRKYATEPSKKKTSKATWLACAAALGGGTLLYNYLQTDNPTMSKEATKGPKETMVDDKAKAAFTGGEQGWFPLKLDSVENISHNTKRFRFALPEEDQVSGLYVASALLTKYKSPEMEKPTIRPYTPVSDEDQAGFLDLLVKKYPNGIMSTHLHDMTPGQSLDFKGPIAKYPWTPNKHHHIALIAGGTGIAPMYQLARAICKNPEDRTKITLVFGNVSEEDILLRKELAELENTYPQRFRAFYVLDNPPSSWQGGSGFITKELLKTVLPEPKEDNIKIFVCGPPPMYQAISGVKKSPSNQGELDGSILEQLGYTKDQVFKF